MKKLILLATLAVCAVFTGPSVGSAFAANCNASNSATTYNNQGSVNMVFNGTLSGCTGVDQVEFFKAGTGWDDITNIGFHPSSTATDWIVNTTTGATDSFWILCWFPGGAVHTIDSVFNFRIHNSATHTWGTSHASKSAQQAFSC